MPNDTLVQTKLTTQWCHS